MGKKLNRLHQYAITSDGLEQSQPKPLRRYTGKTNTFWVAWEGLTSAMMVSSVVIMFVYGVQMTNNAPFDIRRVALHACMHY